LKLKGIISLKFKPIIDDLPVLVSLQILFLNPPEIDLKFAHSLEIANLAMVKNLIFSSIDRAISDMLVLPNIMTINWGDPTNAQALSFMSVMPCSVVKINVIGGRDIKADTTIFNRLPDSSCRITIAQQSEQTAQVSKSKDPDWHENFEFVLYDERQFVVCSVWDMDFTGRMKLMGQSEPKPVSDIAAAGQNGLWITLRESKNASGDSELKRTHTEGAISSKAASTILISATFKDLEGDSQKIKDLIKHISHPELPGTEGASEQQDSQSSAEDEVNAEEATEVQEHSPSVAKSCCIDVTGVDKAEVLETTGGGGDGHWCSTSAPGGSESEHGPHRMIAMLVVEVHGGHLPADAGDAKNLEIEIGMGSNAYKLGVTPSTKDVGAVSENTQHAILRLASYSMNPVQIGDALGEPVAEVQRVLRQNSWNFEMRQKMPLLLTEHDMQDKIVRITAIVKGKPVAAGKVTVAQILKARNARCTEVLQLAASRGGPSLHFEADFRLFSLNERPAPETPVNHEEEQTPADLTYVPQATTPKTPMGFSPAQSPAKSPAPKSLATEQETHTEQNVSV